MIISVAINAAPRIGAAIGNFTVFSEGEVKEKNISGANLKIPNVSRDEIYKTIVSLESRARRINVTLIVVCVNVVIDENSVLVDVEVGSVGLPNLLGVNEQWDRNLKTYTWIHHFKGKKKELTAGNSLGK